MNFMKFTGVIISLILLIWAGISIAYIWGNNIIDFTTYIKLTITLAILLVVISIIFLIFNEYLKEKRYKDEKFLD